MAGPNFSLSLPARQFAPVTGADNTGALAARDWAGVPVSSRDRSLIPVLHHRGFINTAFGLAADDPPFTFGGGTPSYLEPARYFGKPGTVISWPRAVIFGGTNRYANLVNDAASAAILSDGGVFATGANFGTPIPALYAGYLLSGLPWGSSDFGPLGPYTSGVIPRLEPKSFLGGESLVLLSASNGYIDDGDTPTALMQALLTSDVAQLVAAAARFRRYRVRWVDDIVNPTLGTDGFARSVETQALAAGLDAGYDGPQLAPAAQAALDLASVRSFFNI